MSDWLNLLRTHKAQAIDEQRHAIERSQRRKERQANKLRAEHAALLSVLRETAIETLLLQLAEQAVAGHPRYPTAYVHRTVEYGIEAELAYVDAFVNDPWQGYLWDACGAQKTVKLLPAQLELPRGFFLSKIRWHFHLYDMHASDYRIPHAMIAILTPQGLSINAHGVHPLNSAAAQRALVAGLKHPWKSNSC